VLIYLIHIFIPLADSKSGKISCPIPDLINKSLRENYRAKNGMTEKKRNCSKIASIFTTKIKPVRHDVPSKDSLICLHLTNCTNHASDRFVRYTILLRNFSQRLLLLYNTMNYQRPVFGGKTVFGVFWPWSSMW
jgi:hypothetical protein